MQTFQKKNNNYTLSCSENLHARISWRLESYRVSLSFLRPDISESLLQFLGYLRCKNISAECREWGSGGELRKLHQLPKAVDTKLVSRPRIHAETTQGAGATGGLTVCPPNGSSGGWGWPLREAEWYLPNRHGANSIHQRPYTQQPWLYGLLA